MKLLCGWGVAEGRGDEILRKIQIPFRIYTQKKNIQACYFQCIFNDVGSL